MCILELFVFILAFVLLVCCWLVGEQEVRSKLIVTGVYLLTWILALVNAWLILAAQALFCVVVGHMTFGSSFGRRR